MCTHRFLRGILSMKLKTVVVSALVAILSTSVAYADDDVNNAPNAATNSAPANENIGNSQANNNPVPNSNATPAMPAPSATDSSNDDVSADTATGDDDY